MESLLRDLRQGARMLVRSPGVTAVAVLALALGIGANTAIFSVVHAVLLRPLPVRDADRLVTIAMTSQKFNVTGAQPGFSVYATWRQHTNLFESMAAATSGTGMVTVQNAGATARTARVTRSYLPTLGVQPAFGRNFLAEEDQPGGARVALLGDAFWRKRFGSDPRVLGATVTVDDQPHTVIGVLPPGFHVDGRPADVYVPLARSPNDKSWLPVDMYARLKPGVRIEQAQPEMEAIMSRVDRGPAGWRSRLWPLRDFQVRDVRLSLWVLLAAVGLVLLIACGNVASLLLARASARQREIAIRAALGAGKGRLARQLLTESGLLALLGGAGGVVVAALCVKLVPLLRHPRLPGLMDQARVDGTVLAFTLVVALLTGLIFGAAPAFTGGRVSVAEVLKEGVRTGAGGGRRRLWNFLVVAETALALVLAIGATLLIQTFFYLRDTAPGFRVDQLVTARIAPPKRKFTQPEQYVTFYGQVLQNVAAVPGVQAASFAQALPLTGDNWAMSVPIEGHQFSRPQDVPILWHRTVEKNYFRTLEIPLRRGRLFDERDNAAAPRVVIVNEAFVRRFWPGQEPIGKHLGRGKELVEVVGVVGDVRHQDTTKDAPVEVFFHWLQQPPPRIALAIRADPRAWRDPLLLEPAVRRAVEAADKDQAVTRFAELQQLISDQIAPKRLSAQMIAVFAGLALVLAGVGIYGVLSFTVAQRTHEIGVRMALGAERGALLRMVVGQAASLAGIGIAIGLAAAVALTRVMKTLLFGVSPTDPLVYAGAAASLLAVAVLAALLPALRASRVDPLGALRVG